MMIDYHKEKMHKMGKWKLLPADADFWMAEIVSRYYRNCFGFGKGFLCFCTLDDEYEYIYVPDWYFKKHKKFVEDNHKKNYKWLSKQLSKFYKIREQARKQIPKLADKDLKKLSNQGLAKLYSGVRGWTQKATIYDHFGWIGEKSWDDLIDNVLVGKLGLKKGSNEYNQAFFKLTKPEEISTTLLEKLGVISGAIKIIKNKKNITKVASELAKKFGWMPVFAYGIPWDEKYYKSQLKDLIKKPLEKLQEEERNLRNYSRTRNKEFDEMIEKYSINKRDAQTFIEFGLALDGRNEAEYVVSFAGFYLLSIYDEIRKRLSLSIKQIRSMWQNEIVDCLTGRADPHDLLDRRGNIAGLGFNKDMSVRYEFDGAEAQKLFKYLEKRIGYKKMTNDGKGICANNGMAKGRVRIVTSPEHCQKVSEGDILISHATTVDYLPAMKKAGAFITEMGGQTCHAAVVAREFGVPAIVGYKDACKTFKDGDMVEVDAENGIVRKLS